MCQMYVMDSIIMFHMSDICHGWYNVSYVRCMTWTVFFICQMYVMDGIIMFHMSHMYVIDGIILFHISDVCHGQYYNVSYVRCMSWTVL